MRYIFLIFMMCGVLAKAGHAQTAEDSIKVRELRVLAEEKADAGDYRYAANILDRALEIDSLDFMLWLRRADIEEKIDGSQDAIYFISRAGLLDSMRAEPYNRASIYYSARGNIEAGVALINKALSLTTIDSVRVGYLVNRGAVYIQGNDLDNAIKDFQAALKLDPTDYAARNNLAATLGRVGRDYEAIEQFKKLKAVTQDTAFELLGIAVNLGLCYSDIDSFEQSLHYFDLALSINPDEALAYSNRSSTLRKLGRLDEALESINKSIALYPANSYAYMYLAEIYFDQGLVKEGCRTLDYADSIGFKQQYGEKTEELRVKHCQ